MDEHTTAREQGKRALTHIAEQYGQSVADVLDWYDAMIAEFKKTPEEEAARLSAEYIAYWLQANAKAKRPKAIPRIGNCSGTL